jgi:membrane protein DedA with SNARE-associated domain
MVLSTLPTTVFTSGWLFQLLPLGFLPVQRCSVQADIDSGVLYALIVAAVVIVVAVAFLVIRRRKKLPEVEIPQA